MRIQGLVDACFGIMHLRSGRSVSPQEMILAVPTRQEMYRRWRQGWKLVSQGDQNRAVSLQPQAVLAKMKWPDRRALRRTGICSQRNPRTTTPTAAATSADIRDLRLSAVANSAMSNTHPPTSSGVQRFIGPSGISVGRPLSPAPPTKAVLPFVCTRHRSPALASDRWLAPTKAENPTF